MTDNIEKIVQEAECVAAADEYFKARTWLMDTNDNRRIFEAGFDRAYALLSKLRAPVAGEPEPYVLGNQYLTQGGDLVRLVTVANAGTSYESMACEAGIHRYTRRDFGRVTGSPHDYSDPRNIPPLYAAPQASTVAGEALTRFCPECGLVGDVASGYRSCCPDGGSARMIPVSMAKKCRDNFLLAINRDAAPQASEAVRWLVTDDMRAAVRFAPSSAHWSERLKEFFGPDAREGINALEKQLREARAMLDRQQRAGDSVDLEAAAKTLAECMDYPWTEMPEQGRAHMRTFAQSVVNAALSAQPGAQKYWLCCGSKDPNHSNRRAPDCFNAAKAKWGTADQHSAAQKNGGSDAE